MERIDWFVISIIIVGLIMLTGAIAKSCSDYTDRTAATAKCQATGKLLSMEVTRFENKIHYICIRPDNVWSEVEP